MPIFGEPTYLPDRHTRCISQIVEKLATQPSKSLICRTWTEAHKKFDRFNITFNIVVRATIIGSKQTNTIRMLSQPAVSSYYALVYDSENPKFLEKLLPNLFSNLWVISVYTKIPSVGGSSRSQKQLSGITIL